MAINYRIFEENEIPSGATKGEMVKASGLAEYEIDYALPQMTLDDFVQWSKLDYHYVLSSTVYIYGPATDTDNSHIWGRMISYRSDVQKKLNEYYGEK